MTTQLTLPKPVTLTLRVPPAMAEAWRAEHRRTYPAHGLNWNSWLISRVALSFAIQDGAVNPPS
jgi:hypothetical protein